MQLLHVFASTNLEKISNILNLIECFGFLRVLQVNMAKSLIRYQIEKEAGSLIEYCFSLYLRLLLFCI